ncbi:hypothetical protein Tco_0976659 [Tanacetum coccineum]|uniref:Reverse transcriptase domain-containing protein n=1 Tax=Tanacetum coccineum TaxID=301880 RepID=A0ABQ5EJ15_9ASTR
MPPRRAPVAKRAPVARRATSARTANNPARNASTTTDAPMSCCCHPKQQIEHESLKHSQDARNNKGTSGMKWRCSQLALSLGMPLLGGTSPQEGVTQEVSLCPWTGSMKKLMTVKYCPRGENQKAGKSNPNLKVKGTDIPSYTLRFQELALMYRCMFPEESNEVEKYVSGLPDMIRGNVMSYRPQTMEEVIEFCNDNYSQKLITISERQADQKRKIKV